MAESKDYLTTDQQILGVDPEVAQLSRERKIAQLLMAKGLEQPQGQMVSGYYVAPSWTQQLAPALNAAMGVGMDKNLDEKQTKYANALRGARSDAMNTFRTLASDPNTRGQAMTFLGENERLLPELYKTMNSPYTRKVDEDRVLPGVNGESIVLDKGLDKLSAPVQAIADRLGLPKDRTLWSKAQSDAVMNYIPPEERIRLQQANARLADEGIGGASIGGGAPTGVPTGSPMGNALRTGNTNSPMQIGSNLPAYAQGNPQVNPQVTQQSTKPDMFTPPPVPSYITAQKDIRAYRAKQAEPLTGDPAKQVNGAIAYQAALEDLRNIYKNFSTEDMADPNKRVILQNAYSRVTLTGKEAFNLGVLNGGDETILKSLTPNFNDYKSLLVTKDTADKVLQDQKKYSTDIIKNHYEVAQKPVPQNLRRHLFIEEDKALNADKKQDTNISKVQQNTAIAATLKSKGITPDFNKYEYRMNPDGSIDTRRK